MLKSSAWFCRLIWICFLYLWLGVLLWNQLWKRIINFAPIQSCVKFNCRKMTKKTIKLCWCVNGLFYCSSISKLWGLACVWCGFSLFAVARLSNVTSLFFIYLVPSRTSLFSGSWLIFFECTIAVIKWNKLKKSKLRTATIIKSAFSILRKFCKNSVYTVCSSVWLLLKLVRF